MTYSFMTPNNYCLSNVASLWQNNRMCFITGQLDQLSLLPTGNTPLLSRKGSSLNKLLDRFTPLVLCVPELSALTSSKNDFLCTILNMTVAAFPNISTFSGFDFLSNVSFLIFFIHWFLARIIIAITLFILNQLRMIATNLEMTSSLILVRLNLTPFFSSESLSVIRLSALSPLSQVSLHDQMNSGSLNNFFYSASPVL